MVSTRPPATGGNTSESIEVVPLTLHIGAEIRGVDLTEPLPPDQLKAVRDAFLKWKVIFFRDQNLITHSMLPWRASSVSRPSAMRCSAMSRAIPRSTRSPRTGPRTRNTRR